MSLINDFLGGDGFAVVGASNNRRKFGNRVLRCYWDFDKTAYPVNPREGLIEGRRAYASLADVDQPIWGVSLITPPPISEQIVEQAAAAGLTRLWFQPGAESARALALAREHGMQVIAGGACVLVELPRLTPP